MIAKYVLTNGKEVQVFLWSDLLEEHSFRTFVEVTPIYNEKEGRTCKKNIQSDEGGRYFVWNGEKVYLLNFKYETVESLANRIAVAIGTDDPWSIRDDDILATMLKDTQNFGIITELLAYEFICPQIGIGFTGDKEYKTLCVPTEKQYGKERWHYKVTLECECEELRKHLPSRTFYFSDLCSFIRKGYAQVVVIDDCKKEIAEKREKQAKENAKLSNRVARFFGVKRQQEELPLTTI